MVVLAAHAGVSRSIECLTRTNRANACHVRRQGCLPTQIQYAFPHQHVGLHKGLRTGVRGLHILDISIRIGFPLPVFHFL